MHGYRELVNKVSNLAVATRNANALTKRALNTGHPRTMAAAIKANKNLIRMANNSNSNNNNNRRNRAPKFSIRRNRKPNTNANKLATLFGMSRIAPPPPSRKRSPQKPTGRPVRYSTYMRQMVPVFPKFNIKPKMLINPNAKTLYRISGPGRR
jgi:hypothetical protein